MAIVFATHESEARTIWPQGGVDRETSGLSVWCAKEPVGVPTS